MIFNERKDMNIDLKIEPSQSGKTFGLAFSKPGAEKPFLVVKNFRFASGQNGQFASGPSQKMDDGKWFNYVFMDKAFGDYVTKLAQEAMPQQSAPQSSSSDDVDSIPF